MDKNFKVEDINANNVERLSNYLLNPLHEMAKIHNETSENFKDTYPSKPFFEIIEEIKEKVSNGSSKVQIIRNFDNKFIGFIQYGIQDSRGEIEYLYVEKKYQKKGYGKLMIENALVYFRLNKIANVDILVVNGNKNAEMMYNHLGFKTKSKILSLAL